MSLALLSDESILRYHANIRSQAALDCDVKSVALLGSLARDRARSLEDELRQRRISFEPIAWSAAAADR